MFNCHKLKQPALVDLLLSLPQHIPPGYLLPKWPLYFSTFNLYLMHPASTVRQVTSVAFKYLGKFNVLYAIVLIEACDNNVQYHSSGLEPNLN